MILLLKTKVSASIDFYWINVIHILPVSYVLNFVMVIYNLSIKYTCTRTNIHCKQVATFRIQKSSLFTITLWGTPIHCYNRNALPKWFRTCRYMYSIIISLQELQISFTPYFDMYLPSWRLFPSKADHLCPPLFQTEEILLTHILIFAKCE